MYRPASEVSGDFFLISPDPDSGSLLAIVGDVSGKGLNAAMLVSMIIGILRRESSREPAQVLANVNQALFVQSIPGFVTACCMCLEQTGAFTSANAGHISPYLEGIELSTAPALPLGLTADQSYSTTAGVLPVGQQLVLMSDGVPEARSATGELYGFERLQALTLEPALVIAETAQAFGQEDDITVISLACIG